MDLPQPRVVALYPGRSPEQWLRELASRYEGRLRFVAVGLVYDDEPNVPQNNVTVDWNGATSPAVQVYLATMLQRDLVEHARQSCYAGPSETGGQNPAA